MGLAFQAVVNTIAGAFSWVWMRSIAALDALLSWVVSFVGLLLTVVVDLLALGATLMITALPDMPTPAHDGIQAEISNLATANAFIPMSEAMVLLGITGGILAGIGLYKAYKAIAPWAA